MERVYLWENEVPLFNAEYGTFKPYIDLYLLENGKNDNPCIVVIPGGGYGFVSIEYEGDWICRFLNENGYSAVMLNYRVAPYAYPAFLLDAQRAIRLVRYNSAKWNIDSDKIGTIGFSAGGHLCCLTALCFDDGKNDGDDIDRVSCRINTAAPCYAVTSFDKEITHIGTRDNFFGYAPDDKSAFDFSAENMIRKDMPPVFMWHTAEDGAVNPECSLRFAGELLKHNIPCELHLFPYGGHGLNLAEETPLACQWPYLYVKWLDHHNR